MEQNSIPDVTHEQFVDATTEIRLLHIHAAAHNEPITGDLKRVSRFDQQVYNALSYTWGSTEEKETIQINGKIIHVTANCAAAIRHLRDERKSVTIWIDAICINQADPVETSAQIEQMRDIYKSAAQVIVWLGNEDIETPEAFDLLTEVSGLGRHDAEIATSTTTGSPSGWAAVDRIFKREWFERIWIIQEVSLAKYITIQCGYRRLSWTLFNRALQWIKEDNDHTRRGMWPPGSLFMNAFQLQNEWASRHHGASADSQLEYLLLAFGHWKATNTLDKVYALIGMSQEHVAPELRPDYTKSVCEVYANVVKFFITRDKRLTVLRQCQSPSMYKRLPSWVPDWTPDRPYRHHISEPYRPPEDAQVMMTATGAILIPSSLNLPDSGYGAWQQDSMIREEMSFAASLDILAESYFPSASDASPPVFYCTQGPDLNPDETMSLKGIEIDIVHSVTKPLFRTKEDLDDPVFFLAWEEFAIFQMPPNVVCPYGGTFEGRIESLWRTISTDRIYQARSNLRAVPTCRNLFERWRAKLVRAGNSADAYVPETAESIDPNDVHARARVLYNSMATLNLSEGNPPETQSPGAVVQETRQTSEDRMLREYENWKQMISQLEDSEPSFTAGPASELREEYTLANFEATLRLFCFARKLARTKSGRLALVPEHTRPGDKIFILYGGSVPYALRAIPGRYKFSGYADGETGVLGTTTGSTYMIVKPMHQFIGELYVHGIMNGEALEYPPIQRVKRIRQVEQNFSNPGGVPDLEEFRKTMVLKEVLDPLSHTQQMLVHQWREGLKNREQEVWFDSINSSNAILASTT